MQELFATTGMMSVSVVVLVLEAFSLLAMVIIILAFRRAQRKQRALFLTLHDAPVDLAEHKLLVGFYVVMTIVITIVSLYFFVFQPHLL